LSNPDKDDMPLQLSKDMLRATGPETAPRTMAEAAMKVKSLANMVKFFDWELVRQKNCSVGLK